MFSKLWGTLHGSDATLGVGGIRTVSLAGSSPRSTTLIRTHRRTCGPVSACTSTLTTPGRENGPYAHGTQPFAESTETWADATDGNPPGCGQLTTTRIGDPTSHAAMHYLTAISTSQGNEPSLPNHTGVSGSTSPGTPPIVGNVSKK